MKITDEQMKKAFNILIDGCSERECQYCFLDDKCQELFDIESHFKTIIKIGEPDREPL